MLSEHDAAGELLAELRRLTDGYALARRRLRQLPGAASPGWPSSRPTPTCTSTRRTTCCSPLVRRASEAIAGIDRGSAIRPRLRPRSRVTRVSRCRRAAWTVVGLAWGVVGVAIVIALTFIGSDRLVWFDAALVGYLFGVDLRGVRRRLPVRGVAAAAADGDAEPPRLGRVPRSARPATPPPCPSLVATHLLAQGFIRRRSRARWLAHQLVFWGCILAGARHVPAHARPAALRERRPAGRPLPGVRVAGRHR